MKKCQSEALFKLFYLFRQTLPSSQLFYVIFFALKFIGLFNTTHNPKGYEDNLITISSLLQKLTLLGFSFHIISNGYFIASIAFFAILIYIVIHLVIIYIQLNQLYQHKSLNQFDFLLNKQFMSKTYKTFIRLLGFIILLLLFFSQYIQEYLSFILFYVILQTQMNPHDAILDKDKFAILNSFYKNSVISPIAQSVINIISLIILNSLLFVFLLLNSTKALWLKSGFNGYSNKLILICLMLFFWFQSLNSVHYLFNIDYAKTYRIIFDMCAVCILSLYLFSHLKHFNHYYLFVPHFNLFICVWCWYSGIFEILIYYICDKPLTQAYSFLKLIVELINALLVTYLILGVNNRFFLCLFTEHLFNNNQKYTFIGESFAFIHLLTGVLKNNLPQHLELVSMIHSHKSKCVSQSCPCLKLLNDEDKEKNISFKEMVIIIGEQDIVNRIYQIYKKNKSKTYLLEDYCVLHCGYIYKIKQHITLSLYLASMYIQSKLNFSLLSNCFLYSIKKQIIQEVFNKKKTSHKEYNTNDDIKQQIDSLEFVNKKNEQIANNLRLKAFYDYINFIDIIKNLMITCCNGLESILEIRSSLQINSKIKASMDRRQYENFIISCEKIKKNNDKLIKLLIDQMKGEVLCHSKLSYLLTNYFDLFYKKIPANIKGTFTSFSSVSDIPKNEHFRDYLKYNMGSPIVLKFTYNDTFVIDYISTDLCDKLGYNKGSIIGRDIHDFIPIEIMANHRLLLKHFLFIQNASVMKDTFILSAENNIVNILIDSKVLPNMTNPLYIIIDAKIINHKSLNSFVYFLMLDNDLKILAVNQRFEEQFFFNIKMIELLKVNFCCFFGLNQAKFFKKSKKYFKKFKRINLEEQTKAVSIMSNVKPEKMFSYRKMKQTLKLDNNSFEDIIEKQQVIDGLSTLIKIVNDLGLDIEWYNRVRHLNERIRMSMDYKFSNRLSTFYKSIFKMRHIGPQNYYIVQMIEYVDVSRIITNTIYLHESLIKQQLIDLNLETKRNNQHLKTMMKLSSKSISNYDKAKNSRYFVKPPNIGSNASDSSPVSSSKAFDSELMGQSNSTKFNLLQKKALNLNRTQKQDSCISTDNNIINSANTFTSWSKKKSIYNSNTTSMNIENDYIINESKRLKMYVSYNRLSKRYTSLFYSTSIVLLILIGACIFTKFILTNINKGLFNINIYSSMVKTDILYGSLLNIGLCIQINNSKLNDNDQDIVELNNRLLSISNDLIQHYSIFTSFLNTFVSNNNMKTIFKIISKIDFYDFLQDNWTPKSISSSLTELIYIYRGMLSESIFSNKSVCRLKDKFYNEKYKNIVKNESLINKESSIEEQLLFFNIYNLMNKIKPKFEVILEESISILFNYHYYYSQTIIIYNIILWLVTIWLFFVLFNKVIIDQRLTKTICSYIYEQNNQEEDNDEEKLNAFKEVINDFSKKNVDFFEAINQKGISNKQYSNILINKHKTQSTKGVITSSSSPFTQITKQSIHNKTMRLQIQSIPKDKKIFLSNLMNTEILIVIILAFIVSAIKIISILLSLYWEGQIVFSISISIDFLERIPILIELLFYSEISAIMNNIFYIQNNHTVDPIREEYLNYYKIAIDINKNSQVKYLNNSLYATLYYEALLVENNIEEFTSRESNLFLLLRQWEEWFDEKNGICVYGTIGSKKISHKKYATNYDYFEKLNQFVTKCRNESENVAYNDFCSSIEYLIFELTNAYYDFAKGDVKDEKRIDLFLNTQSVYHYNYAIPLQLAFMTYSNDLLNELNILHNTIITNDLLVSFLFLVTIVGIFVYAIIGIIRKSDHYKNLLIFFVSLAFSTVEIDLNLYDD